MSFPQVKLIVGKGTANQQAPGEDYISGLVFYTNTLPSGFSSSARIKQLFSVADAEAAGILNDYSDETRAQLRFTVTGAGAAGDTVTVKYADPITGLTVTLGSYTVLTGDGVNDIATGIVTAINNNTSNTGFTAVAATAQVTITVRKGLGLLPATTDLTVTIVGTVTVGAISRPVTGVASLLAIWHYHISEYFRLNQNGNLFVSFNAVPVSAAAYTYSEVSTMQTFADGKIRNFAVYAPTNYATTAALTKTFISNAVGLLQTQYTTIFNLKQPGQILFATDLCQMNGIANLNLDLATLSGNRVSVIISQDGANAGYALWKGTGYSITDLGATLGVLSASLVSDDFGDLSQFNMTNGVELSVPAFGDGTLLKNVSNNLITQLDLFRYVFNSTYQGYSGVYKNNDHTACPYSDQFAYIHFGRTWDKASRLLYSAYLPFLKAKLSLDSAGKLTAQTVATLEGAGQTALDQMVRNTELSGYTVVVPSNQNPNITGILNITVNLLAQAIANEIDITAQFVASL